MFYFVHFVFFVELVAILVLIQIANVFGTPPPSTTAIAWAGQAQWLLVAWGYWIDSHRRAVTGEQGRT